MIIPLKITADNRSLSSRSNGHVGDAEDTDFTLVPEELFRKVLSLERKRSGRSQRRFVLMLVHTGKLLQAEGGETNLGGIMRALCTSTRETVLHGWYCNNS